MSDNLLLAAPEVLHSLPLPERQPRLPAPKVPWWASARARQLLERVGTLTRDDARLVHEITQPLVERLRRKPTLRPEKLVELERAWRTKLDNPCRLALVIDKQKRGGFCISDCRISISANRFGDWPSGHRESGLAIMIARLTLTRDVAKVSAQMLAGVSEHSLARYFQRSLAPSDEGSLR